LALGLTRHRVAPSTGQPFGRFSRQPSGGFCQREGRVGRKEEWKGEKGDLSERGGLSKGRRRRSVRRKKKGRGLSGLKGGGGREVCRKEGNTQQSVRKVDAEAKLFHTIIAVHDSRVDSGKVTKAFGKSHDRAVQKL